MPQSMMFQPFSRNPATRRVAATKLMTALFVFLWKTSSILVVAFVISPARVRRLTPEFNGDIDRTAYCRSITLDTAIQHTSSSSLSYRTSDVQCWIFPRKYTSTSRSIIKTTTTLYDSSSVDSDLANSFTSSGSDAYYEGNDISVDLNGNIPRTVDEVSNGISLNGISSAAVNNGASVSVNGNSVLDIDSNFGSRSSSPQPFDSKKIAFDVPMPTANGGFTHTSRSKAKISAANKGKTPWNKGKQRSEEVKARIAAGVRAKNRERFLLKLKDMGVTEEEYEAKKKEERRKKEAERRARRTEKGGYRPTEETKQKISKIIKGKWARGEIKPRQIDPSKVRRGFTHTEETRARISEGLKKRWATDEEYRENQMSRVKTRASIPEVKRKISETLKKKWQDPEFRQEMMEKRIASGAYTNHGGTRNEAHRAKISESMKAKWQDPDYRTRCMEAIAKRRTEREIFWEQFDNNRIPQKQPKQPKKPRAAKASTKSSATAKRERRQPVRALEPMLAPRPKVARKAAKRASTSRDGTSRAPPSPELTAAPTAPAALRRPTTSAEKSSVSSPELPPPPLKPTTATTPATAATSTVPMKEPKKKRSTRAKKEKDGSVSRLREERRDLFDLLYGDEYDEDDEATSISKTSFSLGDEDLDSFDPYGLEDY